MFRRLLRRLFLWRLNLEKPDVVVLGMDAIVLDDDEAAASEVSQPTYEKVKDCQPLQLTWGAFSIDAVFRGGKENGNAGDMAGQVVRDVVAFIRERHRKGIAIGYICSGELHKRLFSVVRPSMSPHLCHFRPPEECVDRDPRLDHQRPANIRAAILDPH